MRSAPPLPRVRERPPRLTTGEPLVWGTAMGLTVGLAMILYLLGLILVNGVTAFWPRRVAWLELRPGSAARLGQAAVLAGEVVAEQAKRDHLGSGPAPQEWQLFLGNKDVYGQAFRYVDAADVVRRSYPRTLMVIERLEYGDAIGVPVALEIKGEGVLPAEAPRFAARLRQLVEEVNRRRARIRQLEKRDIGALNARMEKLRLRQRALERARQAGRDVAAAWQAVAEEMAALQARYEALAQQARHLRQQQDEHALVYRLATGEERRLPLGQVVHYYYPNRLSVWQRLGLLARNVWVFLSEEPREANTEGGVFPAIFGTFVMTVLMSLAVTPFGVVAALYLLEYARQGLLVRLVRIAVSNLAGVPSIVFGVFGLGFFVYGVGGSLDALFFAEALPTPTFGTGGILWASLTLALMTVPVVIVATEEALAAVPRGMREGSLALGASKWQTIQRIVLPAAAPGILTGLILAMARGAGEVAPLMLVGVVKLAPSLPIDTVFPFIHLERKFMHLGFHIYDLGFQSPDAEAAKPMVFATTLLLITLVVVLNLGALYIREKLRRKYATAAF
ncbi:MAG: phosphate transport system permease protein PstA [Candidatus Tectimicrobiota bacterium]|nr:MAG: phosphate transport system permease protein PstA [Candidatus Tectomicrobia bacterium]